MAAAESITASDEDVDRELAAMAAQVGQSAEELKSSVFAGEESRLRALRLDVQMRKAREWVLERVEITDPDGNPVERSSLTLDGESELPPTAIESQVT